LEESTARFGERAAHEGLTLSRLKTLMEKYKTRGEKEKKERKLFKTIWSALTTKVLLM